MSSDLPEGRYTGPDGRVRYWDGQSWYEQEPAQTPGATAVEPSQLPEEAGSPTPTTSRRKWPYAVAAALLLLVAGGAIVTKTAMDNQAAQTAVAAQAQEAQAAASAAAQVLKDQRAASASAEASKAAEQAAQEAEDTLDRAVRAATVKDIEASVLKMAKKHASSGAIDGPIKSVSCVPVAGGSVDDLTEKTTKFECFAVNKDNGDGTSSGYYYNATINWDSGSYTYGLGRS